MPDVALYKGAAQSANCTSQLVPNQRGQLLLTALTAAGAAQPPLLPLRPSMLPIQPGDIQQLPQRGVKCWIVLLLLSWRPASPPIRGILRPDLLLVPLVGCAHRLPRATMNAAEVDTAWVGLKGS